MKQINLIIALLISTLTVISCNTSNDGSGEGNNLSDTLVKVEGGKYKGGTLKVNSIVSHTTLFPAEITDIYSQHIASQLFDGLLKFNQKTLEVEPCIAETYQVDPSNKVYTFNIRKGVKFHNDECFENGVGRDVTANDFKATFEFLCSNDDLNKSQYLLRDIVKGGIEYSEGKATEVTGIKAVNDYTLEIELNDPFSGFTNVLALTQTAVFPKEAFDKYGKGISNHPVGAGPYYLNEATETQVVLLKNENYWKTDEFGNKLPLIEQINIGFESDKASELAKFKDGKLDFVWGIPVEEIPNTLGTLDEAMEGKNKEFIVQSVNSLQVQYYGFTLGNNEVIDNKMVRKALNYAIDKDTIINYILEGEGLAATHGIIPKMGSYPSDKVKGYSYNPTKAKKLLADAGYPNGENLPTLKLSYNKAGQINELIALEIKRQLAQTLNVNIELTVLETQVINKERELGTLDFWRYGWIADYPDPSNFIAYFHSKYNTPVGENSINLSRYNNPEFDKFFDLAMSEPDGTKRMDYFAQAEQILIDDAVVIPILYASEVRLINPQLNNFQINEIEFRDYSVCYFTPEKTKKKVRVYDNLVDEESESAE